MESSSLARQDDDSPSQVTVRAPACLDLVFRVGEELPSGEFELATLCQALNIGITVCAERAEGEEVIVRERAEHGPAFDAAQLIAGMAPTPPGAVIEVVTELPARCGLSMAGAEQAATLLACNSLWQVGLSREELVDLASELGDTAPFALTGGCAVSRGGQRISVLARGQQHWVLAFYREAATAGEVKKRWRAQAANGRDISITDQVLATLVNASPAELAHVVGNDLTGIVAQVHPRSGQVLEELVGTDSLAAFAAGFGPTVVALAADRPSALEIADSLRHFDLADLVLVASSPAPGARILEQVRAQ